MLRLANRWRACGDIAAANELVCANLRHVVAIAHQFRGYGLSLARPSKIGQSNRRRTQLSRMTWAKAMSEVWVSESATLTAPSMAANSAALP